MEHQVFANQTDLNFKFETGPLEHALAGGLELSREEQNNRNGAQTANQPLADLFDPDPGQAPLASMPAIDAPWTKAQADTVALFAADTIKLSEKWQLLGGVRYDHIETDFSGTSGRTDDLLSWRSGLVFKPRSNGSIYFGYGTSFNPSLEGNTGISGNILNLDPEEAQIYELGTKWDFFEERLALSAAVFRSEKTNVRTPDVANTGVTVLEGEQTVNGFELGAAGSITKEWRVFAAYTFLDSKVNASNNPGEESNVLGNTPEHSASLWTTYQLPYNFEIGGGLQYVGDRRNNNTSAARIAPDYWVFDATAAYRLNEHFTLRLNVYNLADEQYIDRVGGGHFIPGAGRSAVVTANFMF
jgi:catecholate siderophore receptor